MKWFFNLSLLIVGLSACSHPTYYRKYQSDISSNIKDGEFDNIKNILEKKNFHEGEESVLLKNLETGMYLFNTKNYCQAVDYFDEAYKTTQLQQSKDISSSITSFFGGLDIYYGDVYELSLIRFYQSLLNYSIYNDKKCSKYVEFKNSTINKQNTGLQEKQLEDKEIRQKFSSSRANIIEWDSFLEGREIKKENRFYSKDLLQKIWGAFIHEQQGTLADKQIALQLYKDAKDVALNRYAVYSEFNKNNQTYIANLDKIESKKLYLDANNKYVQKINQFTDKQIARLQNNKKANFSIVLFNDVISEKKAERVNVPTSIFFKNHPLLLYTANIIHRYNVSFEAPYLYDKRITEEYSYRLTNKKTKKITENNIVLVEPISNIAYTSFLQTRDSIMASIVARISNNFQTCINETIQEQKKRKRVKMKGGMLFSGDFVQLLTESSIRSYAFSIKYNCYSILNDKEKIDARQWVSLPSNIFIATDHIDDGVYLLEVIRKDKNGKTTTIKQMDLTIKDGSNAFINVLDYNTNSTNVISNSVSKSNANSSNNKNKKVKK